MPPKRKRAAEISAENQKSKSTKNSKESIDDSDEVLPPVRSKRARTNNYKEDSSGSESEIKPKKQGKRGRKPKIIQKEESSGSESEIKPKKQAKKSKNAKTKEDSEDEEDEEVIPAAKGRKKAASVERSVVIPKNKTATSYDEIEFDSCPRKNDLGEEWNFKISNWNVDGIRAWIKKGGLDYIQHEKPDVFCLQETKCALNKLPPEAKEIEDYKPFWHCSAKDGYAGVALYSKEEPISVVYGLGDEEHDDEGRMITAEFDKFYIISVYVPNSGRGLTTLPKRLKWNEAFRDFVADLDKKKPVIVCGDMNVSHLEIDLANPSKNTKNAGFTKEERDGMTEFLRDGFIDTYRKLYPEKTDAYTFWTYMANCRAKNIGWRLDYFIVSERFMDSICDNIIRNEVFGSDHCPISLFLHV